LGGEGGVDGRQDLQAQIVRFKQMAKPQDGAFVGKMVLPHVQSGKLTEHRRVVQRLFHGRVRQVEPLLQKVDAQHCFHRKRWTPTFGTTRRRVWRNQAHKLSPRHDQVHLVEELALARSLGLAFKSSGAQAHLLHADTVSHSGLHAEVFADHP
jgi:hypothetical protein